jgi:hypothetical protein
MYFFPLKKKKQKTKDVSQTSLANDSHLVKEFIRAGLVHCNGYYNVIGINITRNRRNCNGIFITIHLFGDN